MGLILPSGKISDRAYPHAPCFRFPPTRTACTPAPGLAKLSPGWENGYARAKSSKTHDGAQARQIHPQA